MILVGNDPASEVYVKGKRRDCEQVGVHSTALHLPKNTPQSTLENHIDQLNEDELIDGILVQNPCPRILMKIASLTVSSPVRMWMDSTPITLGAWPCAVQSYAAARLRGNAATGAHWYRFQEYRRGDHSASNHVGRPMGLLLLAGSTVTTAHKFTKDTGTRARHADLLISAGENQGWCLLNGSSPVRR